MRLRNIFVLALLLVVLMFLISQLSPKQQTTFDASEDTDDGDDDLNIIGVGIIVDMKSPVSKVVLSCVKMAISDANNAFYTQNGTSRIVLHKRDSNGEPFNAITAAKDRLESKVEAIIVPEMASEASIIAALGDKASVPILSFTSIPFPTSHPYFLQITKEEIVQFKGIISLLETFNWRNVVLIHKETSDVMNQLPYLLKECQEKNIHLIYKNALSLTAEGHQAIEEFHKLKSMQRSIFVVHTSHSTASKIFANSNKKGMMNERYGWVITSKTMNVLDSLEPSVIESMQGALGFKSYIPASTKLQNFTWRWKNEVEDVALKPNLQLDHLNILGMRAYDTIWALLQATASLQKTESSNMTDSPKSRISSRGSRFLNLVIKGKFSGLGGDFRYKNGKLVFKEDYELVNVVGAGDLQRVGFWTLANRFTKEVSLVNILQAPPMNLGLNSITWPWLSTNTSKGRELLEESNGKTLKIGVPVGHGFEEFISVERDVLGNIINVSGFCKDVFDAAIYKLGYDVPHEFIPFGGDASGSGFASYNDLTYQVFLKKYDVAIGDITITDNRSRYVDFTLPFTDIGVATVAQLNRENKWFFLKPLNANLWITIPCFCILMGVIVWLLKHPINEEFQGSKAQQIGTILWFSVSTLVYAHRERLRSNLSKFVVGVWLFVVFIFASSYTAILSSTLTVQQIELARGDYIGGMAGFYASSGVIVDSNFDFANDTFKPYSSMEDFNDALSKGSKHGGVSAIMDELPYIQLFLSKYPSHHVMVDTSPTTNGFGFAFQKGSPLVSEISRAIAKLREEGKLLELEKKWYNKRNTESQVSSKDSDRVEPKTLDLEDFVGLFLVSGISKIIALLIFLIFFIHKKLSIDHHYGKLAAVMKYLLPKMANVTSRTLPT